MTDINDADRLAADGVPIEIRGVTYIARFSMRAMKDVEQRYGSLVKVAEMLRDFDKMPLYGTVSYLMWLALRHQCIAGSIDFISEDWLLDNVSPRRVTEYASIIFDALIQALPSDAVVKPGEENPTPPSVPSTSTPTVTGNGSPGADFSGLPSPSADSPQSSSGMT